MIFMLIILIAIVYIVLMAKFTMYAFNQYPDQASLKMGRKKIYQIALLVNTVFAVGIVIVEMIVARL